MTAAHPIAPPIRVNEASPRYVGWRVVFACYVAAVFCWGFGLYGHGVYLAELNRLHGWSTWLASSHPLLRVDSPPCPTSSSSHLLRLLFLCPVICHCWGTWWMLTWHG